MLRTPINLLKENGFTLAKERSRRYLAQTITDVDYAADIALLANIPTEAESLLHSLERVAGGISLHVNAGKTEYMCFNERDDISTLNGGSLKLMDKFNCLKSSVSSTENDINTRGLLSPRFVPLFQHKIEIFFFKIEQIILVWLECFAMCGWLRRVCHMTEVVWPVAGNCCGWLYRGSWCADTLYIASLLVWFESCTDKRETGNSGIFALRFQTGP